jgi:hypothetical protein
MIPAELRALKQWVAAGDDKEPISPRSGFRASVNNSMTWGTYDEALATGLPHVGFVLTAKDPYTLIDLDSPQSPDQVARHTRIYELFDTYAELSQSGKGVHIICRGSVPQGVKRDRVEVYSESRYMICTGRTLRDVPIVDCQELLTQLWDEMQNGVAETDLVEYDAIAEDADVVEMAAEAANGDKFTRLCNGQWEGEWPSQSEADFALLAILAFYTPSNEQVKRLFRMSRLGKRDKALRDDYLDRCLRKIRSNQPDIIDFSQLETPHEQTRTGLPAPVLNGSADVAADRHAVGALPAQQPAFLEANGNGHHPIPPVLDFRALPDGSRLGNALLPGVADVGYANRAGDSSLPRNSPVNPSGTLPVPPPTDTGFQVPPGFVGDVARYIYATAHRPVLEISVAAAIALCSGVVGRQFNISGSGLNQYMIVLADTGVGKEGGTSGIDRLVSAVRMQVPLVDEFIGPAVFSSGQGMLRAVNKQRCFVSILGEFGLMLQSMTETEDNALTRMMRRVMLDLYTKSGRGAMLRPSAYADTAKNTEPVESPAVTLLGESTPETFYSGLSLQHIADGLIPRFLIIEYRGKRPDRNRAAFAAPPEWMVNRFAELLTTCLQMQANNAWANVDMTADAQMTLDAFDLYCDEHIRSGSNDGVRQLWNRAHLKALRLCGMLAAADRPHAPCVTLEEAVWAIELVKADAQNISNRFATGDVGEGDSKQAADLERIVQDYLTRPFAELETYGVTRAMHSKRVVPYVYIQRRAANLSAFRKHRLGARIALQETLKDFVRTGRLVEMDKGQLKKDFDTTQQAFFVPV